MPDPVIDRVIRVISETQKIPADTVKPESTFADLKIDSLDAINILFALENEFNISIPDEAAGQGLKTVQDLAHGGCGPARRRRRGTDGMTARRVAVTGIGTVSALGNDVPSFRRALCAGISGIRPLRNLPAPLRFVNGAEAVDYESSRHFSDKESTLLDRAAQFALVAAREAVRDAGITFQPERSAVVTGCSVGGQNSMDEGFVDLYQKGLPRVNPLMIPRVMGNAGASHITMEMGITGPAYTVSTACASSTHAIGQAFWMVRSGAVDAALTGGHEAVFSWGFLKAWEAMRVVSPDTCRPFAKDRRGMILGEGGAMLVLEEFEARALTGRTDLRRDRGIRHVGGRAPHHTTFPGGRGPGHARRSAGRRNSRRVSRLHQRARHRHDGERRHRVQGDPAGFRRACGAPGDQFHQVDAWPRAGRSRRARGRRDYSGVARWRPARPPRTSRSATPSAISTSSSTRPACGTWMPPCRIPSHSAASTRCWRSSGPYRPRRSLSTFTRSRATVSSLFLSSFMRTSMRPANQV